MLPQFFATPSDFRKWLEKNHKIKTELLVGFYKVGSNKPSINWSQSVDEALCFGWIDGVRRSIDTESYCIRFTPRKATSIWSAINIKKVDELTKKGLIQPAGIESFNKRKENKSKIYSYENEAVQLSADFEKKFKANKKAWAYFISRAPSYKKAAIHIVMAGKQEATRIRRLEQLINSCETEEKIKQLNY